VVWRSGELLDEHGVELGLHLEGDLADVPICAIVQYAVVEDQVHVALELALVVVAVVGDLALDGPEVHGVLDDGGVVQQSELLVVDWLAEEVRI